MTDSEAAERLLAERQRLRSVGDYGAADRIREQISELGYKVVDGPLASRLENLHRPGPVTRVGPGEQIASRLRADASYRFTCLVTLHGWAADAQRWIASLERWSVPTEVQAILVDNSSDDDLHRWVETVSARRQHTVGILCDPPRGFADATNLGLQQALGSIVVIFDPGVELVGDALGMLGTALADPSVAVVGRWGVVSSDMREFGEVENGAAVAIEGYCLGFRRSDLIPAGLMDAKFNFYRMADVDFSCQLRAAIGGSALALGALPLRRHQHRLWEQLPAAERDRLSKRNFYHFYHRWHHHPELLIAPT